MKIENVKKGVRVRIKNGVYAGGNTLAERIPRGTVGTVLEDHDTVPYISWDVYIGEAVTYLGTGNVYPMHIGDIKIVKGDSNEV